MMTARDCWLNEPDEAESKFGDEQSFNEDGLTPFEAEVNAGCEAYHRQVDREVTEGAC